jgi:hypothetical protein
LWAGKIRTKDEGDALAGILQYPMCTLTELMLAGRVGITLGITPRHGLDDLGPGGSGGVMIQINCVHYLSILGSFGRFGNGERFS